MTIRAAVLLWCIAVSGCADAESQEPAASSATSETVPSATAGESEPSTSESTEHQVPDLDASITLPAGWVALTVDDIGAGFEEARAAHPDAASMLDNAEAEMRDGDVRFFAFESKPAEGGFLANLSIAHVDGRPPPTEEIAQQLASSIEDNVEIKGDVEAGTATLSAGEVALVTYVAHGAAGGPDAWITQFAFPRETDGLVLTLAAPNDMLDAYSDTWQDIANSVTY